LRHDELLAEQGVLGDQGGSRANQIGREPQHELQEVHQCRASSPRAWGSRPALGVPRGL